MIKYLELSDFRDSLLTTIKELSNSAGEPFNGELKFIIRPIIENGKSLNSTDDFIHRTVLNEKNLNGRMLDIDAVMQILGCRIPLAPLWINVSLEERNEDITLITLQTSLRFRKPNILQNQETGHPPFKAITSN